MNLAFYKALQDNISLPFVWGENDCCLFAANVLRTATGIDYAAEYRGRYNSKYSAYRLIAKAGGIEAILLSKGFVRTKHVQPADVCIYNGAVGITDGRQWFFAGGANRRFSEVDTIYTAQKQG